MNLGYVINVIEDARERAAAVRAAWELSTRLLVVATQIEFAAPDKEHSPFGDGENTGRGTFQTYYTQNELRAYLERELGVDAIPAAPGVFYIFKDEATKQQFLATRFHRRIAVPRKRISELRFEQNLDVLKPMMAALTQLGRLPAPEEFPQSADGIERFRSLNKAVALIRRVTEEQPWERRLANCCERRRGPIDQTCHRVLLQSRVRRSTVRHEYYFAKNAETKPLDEFRAVIAETLDEDSRNPSSVDGSGDRERRRAHEARGRAANVFVARQRGIALAAGRTAANRPLLSVLGWTGAHRCRVVSTNVEQLPYPKRCPRRPSRFSLALNRPELIEFT